MLQIIIFLLIFVALVIPMGKYLFNVADNRKSFVDPVCDRVDNALYKITFVDKKKSMNWKQYIAAILITNVTMIVVGFVLLLVQGLPILNPNGVGGMKVDLAFNTIVSFMTNTNLQHYSGESGLTYMTQMFVIIFMMFTSAATGYCACMAFIRGICGKVTTSGEKTLGNYYVDMVRIITRVLLPFSLIIGLVLISQGTPQTLAGTITAHPIWGGLQDIATGPIAALEAIKHLGTNGGGFLGANSSTPFENPTIISNMVEMLSMMMLPGACVIVFGRFMAEKKRLKKDNANNASTTDNGKFIINNASDAGNGKFVINNASDAGNGKFVINNASNATRSSSTACVNYDCVSSKHMTSSKSHSTNNNSAAESVIKSVFRAKRKNDSRRVFFGSEGLAVFISMGILLLAGIVVCFVAESSGSIIIDKLGLLQNGSMEGKEVRFGIAQSSLFTCITTAFSTGTVNNMHDTLTPIGGLVPLLNMMLNVVFGGIGVGFMNMIMYFILTVFICGLMIGRTPEYLGKKIEGKEMKLVALSIIIHPLLILGGTAIAVMTLAGQSGVTNPGFHGLSQILYEFTSSAANNGSGFEGLADNTLFYNISTAVVMFFGRYLPIILQLMIAGSLMSKKPVSENSGMLRTDTMTFSISNTVIVVLFAALTFFLVLVLAPIAEQLTMMGA